MKGHVSKDGVHLFVSMPPQVTISRLLQWLKGKTAHHLMLEFPHVKKQFWDGTCGSGNVTDETVVEYVPNQKVAEGAEEDFELDG